MSTETMKVDVLAVIGEARECLSLSRKQHKGVAIHDALARSGAVMAELIEADLAFDMARRNFAPCSDEVLEASARRSAALARVGGDA